ncbi:MAG: zinc-binding dehydrogenase [Tabrizicola sp.]|nr:zinc-binding dehydrogenase [Tabrizicola sp.]
MTFTTQAMVMRAAGGPEVLEYRPQDLTWDPEGTEVLVRLVAAGVNPADTYFRSLGPYIGRAEGCVLGHDGAGIVQAAGRGVTGFAPGDRVCFCHGGVGGGHGTYARHAVVPADCLVRVPDSIALEDAAAIALVFITGWEAMVERAGVGPGDLVLIHGGAGGTGQMATQIARAMGARVATTVSSPAKAGLSTAAGAERAILYRDEDFVAATMDWSGGKGVKAVLDNIGGDGFLNSLRVLQPYGHIVTLMGTPGDLPDGTAYNANLTIHNVMMLTPMWKGLRPHLIRQAAILRRAMAWLAEGKVFVRIQESFPLVSAVDAHRLLESAGGSGKIILTMPHD